MPPKKFGYEKETLKPTVVDLWGSCISRTNLNFDDERNFVTSAYLFQVPPFVESTPVNYNKAAVKRLSSSWYDQIVQDELAGTYIKKLITSPGEWLLIDFSVCPVLVLIRLIAIILLISEERLHIRYKQNLFSFYG